MPWVFPGKTRDSAMPTWISTRDDYRWVQAVWRAYPHWLSDEHRLRIRAIYREAKRRRQHVDHIVPLRGPTVCGLHVPWNLQIVTEGENRAKSNLYWPGGPERLRLALPDPGPHQRTLPL